MANQLTVGKNQLTVGFCQLTVKRINKRGFAPGKMNGLVKFMAAFFSCLVETGRQMHDQAGPWADGGRMDGKPLRHNDNQTLRCMGKAKGKSDLNPEI